MNFNPGLPPTLHKKQYQWDHRHKSKSQTNKAFRRKNSNFMILGQAKISQDTKSTNFYSTRTKADKLDFNKIKKL